MDFRARQAQIRQQTANSGERIVGDIKRMNVGLAFMTFQHKDNEAL
ncbi:MAG TPA: hypothetical protein VFS47_16690 [Steroidobacteraceae bacterium]|jgi:hypothetical protein|nr:hypothetical protein [Steroidobacteraceae bacterium]